VLCWGDDTFVQLGTPGLPPAQTTVPGAWTDLLDVHGLSTCAHMGAELLCWGDSTMPIAIPELATATTLKAFGVVAAGSVGAACALDANQSLSCLGDNSLGQYGNGPANANCGNGFCDPGDCFICAATDCANIGCSSCGDGICNNGETIATCGDCVGPSASALGRHYTTIAAGWDLDNAGATVCGVRGDGGVECWGRNTEQLIPASAERYVREPVAIAGLAACTSVAIGTRHACALCAGNVLCWGDHLHGAVGSGPQEIAPILEPRQVATPLEADETWVDLQAGATYTCGRTSAGRTLCWGSNLHGALGLGAGAATVPIAVLTE
jgi:hypothetical protein